MMNSETLNIPLKKSLRLAAKIVAVRDLAPGTAVGYMHTAILQKPSRIAVVSFGYADGLPLAISNSGRFLVNGKFSPVVGRISMDYTSISLANVPDACWGDEVVCFGTQQDQAIPINHWAGLKGTHVYDILCSVGSRVKRCYFDS
jgi:alanine racemase